MEMRPQNMPTPMYVPVQKVNSSFGTVAAAMLTGALITVSLLYMWGADVSKQQETIGPSSETSAR
mgnify:CR=1 FL=1